MGETMETVRDFIFLGSQITADGYCHHEIKTLAPWKKSYDQPSPLWAGLVSPQAKLTSQLLESLWGLVAASRSMAGATLGASKSPGWERAPKTPIRKQRSPLRLSCWALPHSSAPFPFPLQLLPLCCPPVQVPWCCLPSSLCFLLLPSLGSPTPSTSALPHPGSL